MNIIVKPYGSDLCYCRPDTTWERENRDFYSPECVNEIHFAPVVFARVSKAGKCIGKKFVERYYDGIGCGVLLYGAQEASCGSCRLISHIDRSSILPSPLYNPVVLEDGEKVFDINTGKDEQISIVLEQAKTLLEDAICSSSELISLRIGDFVAVELEPARLLAGRADGEVSMKGTFCENEIFGFKVIL